MITFSLVKSFEILERTPAILDALLANLSHEWTSGNEGADTWSPYDIVGHLVHGEKTDWIPRIRLILDGGQKPFLPFDRFAQFSESKGKTLAALLKEFKILRELNLAELKRMRITTDRLQLTGLHPELGTVTLQQLLATWTAHDLSHISQIARVMAKQYRDEIGPWIAYMGIFQK